MSKYLDNFLNIGNRFSDDPEVKRKKRNFVPMATSGIFVGLIIAIFETNLDLYPQAYMPMALSILFALDLLLFWIFKSTTLSQYIAFLTLLILPPLNQWSLGGFYATGGMSIWGIAAPFGALIFQSIKQAIPQFIIFIITIIVSLFLEKFFPSPWKKIPDDFSFWFLLFNFPGFTLFVFVNILHFVKQKDNAMNALDREHSIAKKEREKSEKLLLNILPKKIANRLKQNEGYIAESFQNVSILFADIAGFTPLSSKMKPEKLVELLNNLFTHFDLLADKYNLEKIKTIGDAYMAVAGLPEPVANHANACVNMALDMRDYMKFNTFPDTNKLDLRIGIHSGSIVAGVIGKKKFAYDLWGDAVNTASRMESHGVPGEIQITQEVKNLLSDLYIIKERGVINIKGKGNILTFFVVGRKVDL